MQWCQRKGRWVTSSIDATFIVLPSHENPQLLLEHGVAQHNPGVGNNLFLDVYVFLLFVKTHFPSLAART